MKRTFHIQELTTTPTKPEKLVEVKKLSPREMKGKGIFKICIN